MGRKGAAEAQFKIDPDVIDDLTRAVQNLLLHRTRPAEGIRIEASQLAGLWKVANRPLLDSSASDLTRLLVALAVALRGDHELLEWIRQHCPKGLEKLISECLHAEAQAMAPGLSSAQPMLTAKQRYECRRSKRNRIFSNSIEYEFGGCLEADDWRKFLSPFLERRAHENMLRRSQTCLDDIFAGESVNMLRLEELFWIDRHRLAEALTGFQKRRFDYRDVIRTIDFLLKTKPQKKRSKSKPGPSPRLPWLCDEALQSCGGDAMPLA